MVESIEQVSAEAVRKIAQTFFDSRQIALTVCGDCHQVEPAPRTPSPHADAPRFADVAQMPSTTETSLKVFLRSTHPTMPNFQFNQEELESIVAYILGMKRH